MKSLLLLILCVGLSFSVKSQQLKTEFISSSEVPEVVLKAQEFSFPNMYVESWHIPDENILDTPLFICQYKNRTETGYKAYYAENGFLLFHTKFLTEVELPETVLLKITAEFDDSEIQNGYFITISEPRQELYRVNVRDGFEVRSMYYSINGIEIPKNSLPNELLLLDN